MIESSTIEQYNRTINQSSNQSINRTINQAINRTINGTTNRTINQSINQWNNQSIDRSINRTINQSVIGEIVGVIEFNVERKNDLFLSFSWPGWWSRMSRAITKREPSAFASRIKWWSRRPKRNTEKWASFWSFAIWPSYHCRGSCWCPNCFLKSKSTTLISTTRTASPMWENTSRRSTKPRPIDGWRRKPPQLAEHFSYRSMFFFYKSSKSVFFVIQKHFRTWKKKFYFSSGRSSCLFSSVILVNLQRPCTTLILLLTHNERKKPYIDKILFSELPRKRFSMSNQCDL